MTFTCQVLGQPLRADLTVLDAGLSVLLVGGERSHIGAVVVAESDGLTQILDFPGHREREVAEQWAVSLAQVCGCRVSVVCGIHYDNLNHDGIFCILNTLHRLLHDVIRYLKETEDQVTP